MANTLLFSSLTPANPYIVGSEPDNLASHTKVGSGSLRVDSADTGVLRGNGGTLYDNIPLIGDTQISSCVLGAASSWCGVTLNDADGDGYYVEATPNSGGSLKLFLLNAAVQGAQVGATVVWTYVVGSTLTLQRDTATNDMRIYANGVQQGGTYNNATHAPLYAGVRSDGGYIRSMTSDVISAQSLTIATDLTPGSSRTDACTGFPDGAATISFSGVSVPVTVSSNSITWTVPALADGATWPRIPSTGTIITLTQGELSANATGNITLPPGYNTLRVGDVDGGVPANFSGIVTDDPKFLGYHLTLTTSDTWYNPAINGLKVYRNGDVESNEFLVDGVTLALPRTDAHFQQDASGLLTLHNVTMTPAGGLIVETPGLTAASLTMTGLTMRGLTMSGL